MKAKESVKLIGCVLSAFLVLIIFAAMVFRIVAKVRSGHGLDTYLTPEGVEFNYIGALILLLLIPVSLVIGLGIRYWQLRDERSFKKKFGIEE
jgi:hypothetical protein